ncbi:MAG: hypothetical protein HWQ38_30030 [Nostoc sp. NMS7]|uniref:hypothetical protein n=1 Tax=Nostoc sp. NMS7 TaxID=2815391 RepID=UPI0025E6281F|nr:hypothetical protein [Nostoc sp. NMS7]MBN3950477.1 hypothetical protein [Nostoc sp. NMS7]
MNSADRPSPNDQNQMNPKQEPKLVGKLISLSKKGSPSFSKMHIRLNTSAESPQPGSWLAVEAVDANDQQLRILAKVVNSWEHNPHEDAHGSAVNEVIPFPTNYAPEGESTIIYRIAEVEPVKEVVKLVY